MAIWPLTNPLRAVIAFQLLPRLALRYDQTLAVAGLRHIFYCLPLPCLGQRGLIACRVHSPLHFAIGTSWQSVTKRVSEWTAPGLEPGTFSLQSCCSPS